MQFSMNSSLFILLFLMSGYAFGNNGTTVTSQQSTAVETSSISTVLQTTADNMSSTKQQTTGDASTEGSITTANVTENSTGLPATTKNTNTRGPPLQYITPSFRVNNTAGDACMLMMFDAYTVVNYVLPLLIELTTNPEFEGSCAQTTKRQFTLWHPKKDGFCAKLVLTFTTKNPSYIMTTDLTIRYIEQCFPPNTTVNNATITHELPQVRYVGTIGKSFRCKTLATPGIFPVLTLRNILIQPFADTTGGQFGPEETCHKATAPAPTTPPSDDTSGMSPVVIAAIVSAVMLALALCLGFTAFLIRRRRAMLAYGHLQNIRDI